MSSQGKGRVRALTARRVGSDRTAFSSHGPRGRFQMLARTTPGRRARCSLSALFPAPAGPTSSATRGMGLQLRPDDGLEILDDLAQRAPGFHEVRTAAGPVDVADHAVAMAHVVRGFRGLALYGGLGIDAEHDQDVGSEDVLVIAALRRDHPAAQDIVRQPRRERLEARPRELVILGNGVALAHRESTGEREAARLEVEQVPVAGGADVAQTLNVTRKLRTVGAARLAEDSLPHLQQGADGEREERA